MVRRDDDMQKVYVYFKTTRHHVGAPIRSRLLCLPCPRVLRGDGSAIQPGDYLFDPSFQGKRRD